MTVAVPAGARQVWRPGTGTSRGTVLVLVGRGEHPGLYGRLGLRLAADGYTVVAPDRRTGDPGPAEVESLLAEHAGGSRVLLGADSGALLAWRLAADARVRPDGLVLAGLPVGGGLFDGDPEAELAARTCCPVHRALLRRDVGFGWGALATHADAGTSPPAALPALPTLLLHGESDPVAPIDAVRVLAGSGSEATLAVVADGVHDVLNDQFHRSAAARLVLFLEEVGKGAVVRDVSPDPDAQRTRPMRARRAAPVHVSARLDYALRAIAELSEASRNGAPVRCEAIALARGVPLNSLVNLMVELRRAGLVNSRRGCEGGYWPARPASRITVAEVVRAVEGEIVSPRPDGPDSWLWQRLGATVSEFLERWSVQDVADGPREASDR